MKSRQTFDKALANLYENILKMGVLAEEAITKSITCLKTRDTELADKIIREDKIINKMEIDIEDECILLIAKEQPVASDLRKIVTSLKIVTQLERIGDHAVHVAKSVKRLIDEKSTAPLLHVPQMAELCMELLRQALNAFINNDAEKAKEIGMRDAEVDKLHSKFINEEYNQMIEDPKLIKQSITMLFLSRFIERFGDHVTNICEWVVYSAAGEHVSLNI